MVFLVICPFKLTYNSLSWVKLLGSRDLFPFLYTLKKNPNQNFFLAYIFPFPGGLYFLAAMIAPFILRQSQRDDHCMHIFTRPTQQFKSSSFLTIYPIYSISHNISDVSNISNISNISTMSLLAQPYSSNHHNFSQYIQDIQFLTIYPRYPISHPISKISNFSQYIQNIQYI